MGAQVIRVSSQASCSRYLPPASDMPEYKLATNEANKATELVLWRIGGTRAQNPHMRAFWGSTISFFLAFLGWFALAPLGLDVAYSMEIVRTSSILQPNIPSASPS